jgi:LmbE family N-acetylglucosaminyl deacetylase
VAIELFDVRPERAMAIYAHPDDADVACAGTLARWVDEGCKVELVVCARGDKGTRDPSSRREELIDRRAEEVARAASVVGIERIHQLGHNDGEFDNDLSLREEIVKRIRAFRPGVIVCPDPLAVFFGSHYFNHRDHRVCGYAALDAASPAAAKPAYFPDAGPPHAVEFALLSGTLEPDVAIDVTHTIARKADAVACHASQLEERDAIRPVIEERAADVGVLVGVDFAESFRRVYLAH